MTEFTLWCMQFASMRNAARHDSRVRIGTIVSLLISLALAVWGLVQFKGLLQQWQGLWALNSGLWTLCLATWSGMCFLAIISVVQLSLSSDEALLLFTLPLAPATRFRAIYGTFFLKGLWNWLLLELLVNAYALISVLGWQSLIWLLLLQIGVAVVVAGALIGTWLVVCYVITLSLRTKIILITTGLFAIVFLIVSLMIHVGQGWGGPVDRLLNGSGSWLRAVVSGSALSAVATVACAIVLVLLLGPLATLSGKLYEAAFHVTQSWDQVRGARTPPGVRALHHLFERRRTLAAALLGKMLLNQSRNMLFWGRLVIVLVMLACFPLVHGVLAHGIPDSVLVVGYAAGVVILHMIEVAINAISGEGNRLALYLVVPLDLRRILCAKLILFLAPLLIESLLVSLGLCLWSGFTPGKTLVTCLAVTLIVASSTILLVLGSAFDEDLNQDVDGWMQSIMQEEIPGSPRRMWLSSLGLLFVAGMLLVYWKLPAPLALLTLAAMLLITYMGMMRLSVAHVKKLSRVGKEK